MFLERAIAAVRHANVGLMMDRAGCLRPGAARVLPETTSVTPGACQCAWPRPIATPCLVKLIVAHVGGCLAVSIDRPRWNIYLQRPRLREQCCCPGRWPVRRPRRRKSCAPPSRAAPACPGATSLFRVNTLIGKTPTKLNLIFRFRINSRSQTSSACFSNWILQSYNANHA